MRHKLFWLIFGILTISYWFWIYLGSASAAKNPKFIPLLPQCATYTKHCGAEAKRVVQLYGMICQEWNEEWGVCDKWYGEEELSLILSR